MSSPRRVQPAGVECPEAPVRPRVRALRRARGYRTTENFITMAYLVCGKLTFNLPT